MESLNESNVIKYDPVRIGWTIWNAMTGLKVRWEKIELKY